MPTWVPALCVCGGQRKAPRSRFSSLTMWVLSSELRSSGVAASPFTHWDISPTLLIFCFEDLTPLSELLTLSPPASASQVVGLQMCTTTPKLQFEFWCFHSVSPSGRPSPHSAPLPVMFPLVSYLTKELCHGSPTVKLNFLTGRLFERYSHNVAKWW